MEIAVNMSLVSLPVLSEAFGFPCLEVLSPQRIDEEAIRMAVGFEPAFLAEAFVGADQIATGHRLEQFGFRKISVLLMMSRPVPTPAEMSSHPTDPQIERLVKWPMERQWLMQHAQNFTRDRLSQNLYLPRRGVRRVHEYWIDACVSGSHWILREGNDFCSLRHDRRGTQASIDRVSTLTPGCGQGRRLVRAALNLAAAEGAQLVTARVESENIGAWRLCQSMGFQVQETVSVYQLTHGLSLHLDGIGNVS